MDIQLKGGNVDEGVQMTSELNRGHIIELYLWYFTFTCMDNETQVIHLQYWLKNHWTGDLFKLWWQQKIAEFRELKHRGMQHLCRACAAADQMQNVGNCCLTATCTWQTATTGSLVLSS